MCGIAGFWASGQCSAPKQVAQDMASTIAHRGPDSGGVWLDEDAGLALAHRRLAIVDLSTEGHQPMASADGRWMISYNGEIYNHAALRAELETTGHSGWRGHSDTEVLLAAVVQWGIHGALQRCNGMFAIAVWDRERRELTLARDRLGEKPLYYGRQGGSLLFGSELKALRRHPDWQGRIDRDALTLLLRHNYIPAPYCVIEGIRKLPPAHLVTIDEGGRRIGQPECYWRLEDAVARGQAEPLDISDAEAIDQLEQLLAEAVGLRMGADVPLGAFLSGGIDSTAVVALMQAQAARPVQTFSIGFHEGGYDEASHARAVAAHLGTDHHELYLGPKDALAVIPDLPTIFDEPFSDSSQIPTLLVSRMARRHVTVALSGDGGDELFGGYARYDRAEAIWRRLAALPQPLRAGLAWGLEALPSGPVDALCQHLPGGITSDRLRKLARMITVPDREALYRRLISHEQDPAQVVLAATEPSTVLTDRGHWPEVDEFAARMMALDLQSYLPGDILVKVDRASMAASLEARVPMLDHRLVEFAQRLPIHLKRRDEQGKWVLRRMLDRYVPASLMERPKMGFGVPIEHWLRGPLKDWGAALLNDTRLRQQGFFDADHIGKLWREHQSGDRRWHYLLWDYLMFQAWLEAWGEG